MTNPNHTTSATEVSPTPEVRALYDIDVVNEWRSNELLRLGWLRAESIESEAYNDQYVATFKDTIEEKLDDFLATRGVAPGDASYDALRQLYRDSSIDRFSENEWGNSPASRGVDAHDTQSQSEKTKEVMRQWHEAHSVDPETDENERSIDVIKSELNEARNVWSTMQAKRQGRLFDRRIHGYEEAGNRYTALNRELGSRKLEDTINDDSLSDAEKNAAVIAYIFEEQNQLRADTKEKVRNTRVSRFVEKFGGWLNRGNGWTRFGKGALVGLGAGVVGAGAGLLFGAASIGAAMAGAGVLVAKGASFTKFYAKSDASQGRGMEQNQAGLKDEWTNELESVAGDDVVERAANLSNEKFEDDTKKEQGKRRKTMAIAMGGVAVGAAVGVGAGLLLDHFQISDFVHDKVMDGVGGNSDPSMADFHRMQDTNTLPLDGGSEPGASGDGDLSMADFHRMQDTNTLPLDSGSGDTSGSDWVIPNEEFYVDLGHGYSHELVELASANGQELSDVDAWQLHLHLVEKFGPDYINIDGSGGLDTYFENGDVRLSISGMARWEDGVTEEIQRWMQLSGIWR